MPGTVGFVRTALAHVCPKLAFGTDVPSEQVRTDAVFRASYPDKRACLSVESGAEVEEHCTEHECGGVGVGTHLFVETPEGLVSVSDPAPA